MKHAAKLLILLPALALGGCAASSYCEGEQDYEGARSVSVLQPAEGLRLQESSSALKIPPAPANAVPYGETYADADGDDAVRCLDRPPDLHLTVHPKAEAEPPQPAPAPAPAPAP